MQFRLVQNKVVDTADSVDKLDFSGLHGSLSWYVYIIWQDREECIAYIVWTPAEAYRICTCYGGAAESIQVIRYQGCIVPTVRDYLCRLMAKNGPLPLVIVQPIEE